jgi:hypothetical protein
MVSTKHKRQANLSYLHPTTDILSLSSPLACYYTAEFLCPAPPKHTMKTL